VSKASALIRKVVASDREDIAGISSKIWGGHDYLPSVIDEWLASPKCHTYGVEADGRIVAIGNLRLVDRNKTGWMEGLRVHPDYRRKGYADMLTQRFLSLGKALNVQRLRYTTGGNNRASLKLAKKAGFKRLFKMNAVWHEDLNVASTSADTHTKTKEATSLEAFELSRTCSSLFPHNVLIYDWKAVDNTLQGFREVGRDHAFYFTKRRGTLTAFSFGHARPEPEHGRWSFTVYASDEEGFLTHFQHHMNTALSKDLNATVCTCQTQFENTLKEPEELPKSGWKIQLILFEKQMKQESSHSSS
jgi:N-acetylglutamate synthase-like GNAT family acetyltransferase